MGTATPIIPPPFFFVDFVPVWFVRPRRQTSSHHACLFWVLLRGSRYARKIHLLRSIRLICSDDTSLPALLHGTMHSSEMKRRRQIAEILGKGRRRREKIIQLCLAECHQHCLRCLLDQGVITAHLSCLAYSDVGSLRPPRTDHKMSHLPKTSLKWYKPSLLLFLRNEKKRVGAKAQEGEEEEEGPWAVMTSISQSCPSIDT